MQAESEFAGGMAQAERMALVSGMTSLQIGEGGQRKRARSKKMLGHRGTIMSQQDNGDREMGVVEPIRINPSRLAKHTEKGKLGAVALGQRTVGNLDAPNCCQKKKP